MTIVLDEHPVQWVTAAPLWDRVLTPGRDANDAEKTAMQRPEILRFDTDEFMERAQKLLASDPKKLGDHKAEEVSFRSRPPGKATNWTPPKLDHLKLYQAAHGDFYLVVASLVCRIPGLPDRLVQPQNGDRVGFVIRRLRGTDELAWVDDAAAEKGRTWKAAADVDRLADGEELLPLFPMAYEEGDRKRRVFVGVVPTSSGDAFKNAGVAALDPKEVTRKKPRNDPRLDELKEKVIDAVNALVGAPAAGAPRDKRVEASRFVLVDLADLFERELKPVREAISNGSPPSATAAKALYKLLEDSKADTTKGISWRAAVKQAWDEADRISGEVDSAPTLDVDLANSNLSLSALNADVTAALKEHDQATGKPDPTTQDPVQQFDAPKYDLRGATRYVLRCVYHQPQCEPLHHEVLSARSREFAIATFFDVDAPTRPIHITLPLDTSIAALRKSPKNVSFLISNELRQQMNRVVDAKEALKGNLGSSDELDLGFICSLSIPIITICALIVLMIFLSLLNIVFWWMPFFRICFPIPVLKKSG